MRSPSQSSQLSKMPNSRPQKTVQICLKLRHILTIDESQRTTGKHEVIKPRGATLPKGKTKQEKSHSHDAPLLPNTHPGTWL